jgi:hypothetical protein
VRFIPAPTPAPEEELLSIRSQQPGSTIKVDAVRALNPSYIVVEKDGEILYTSEMFSETLTDLEIPLGLETTDGEVLTIKLLEEEKVVYEKEVLITTTALAPGVILPKDLQ